MLSENRLCTGSLSPLQTSPAQGLHQMIPPVKFGNDACSCGVAAPVRGVIIIPVSSVFLETVKLLKRLTNTQFGYKKEEKAPRLL